MCHRCTIILSKSIIPDRDEHAYAHLNYTTQSFWGMKLKVGCFKYRMCSGESLFVFCFCLYFKPVKCLLSSNRTVSAVCILFIYTYLYNFITYSFNIRENVLTMYSTNHKETFNEPIYLNYTLKPRFETHLLKTTRWIFNLVKLIHEYLRRQLH